MTRYHGNTGLLHISELHVAVNNVQDRQCMHYVTLRRIRAITVAVETPLVITYSEVFQAFGTYHEMQSRHTVISGFFGSTLFIPHYLTKA